MDRQVFNWTQTISKNATEVFKNRENLENVKNKEKYIKMAISQSYGLQKKSEGTFFSSTLKVEEKKVPLFFRFVVSGLRYRHFLIFWVCVQIADINTMTKWQYPSTQATNIV